MPSSDIILVGAGRSPHTKQLREKHKHTRRTYWVGPLHVRSGMRFPIDVEFIQKHYDRIVDGIENGTILIEYKLDKFVDAEELKTLGFGSEGDREAYEEKVKADLEVAVAKQKEAIDARAEEAALARQESFNGKVADLAKEGTLEKSEFEARIETPVADIHPATESEVPDTETPGDAEAQDPVTEESGREEQPEAPPEEQFEEDVAASEEQAEETGEQQVEEQLDEQAEEPIEEQVEEDAHPDHARLRRATKGELLGMCEERGIDTSDMPSNKTLRKRLVDAGV